QARGPADGAAAARSECHHRMLAERRTALGLARAVHGRPISSRHEPTDRMGIRHGPAADARHQTDPRPVGRRWLGAGVRPARPHSRTARRVFEAPQIEMSAFARLGQLGVALPEVVAPLAAYVPAVRTGNLVYTVGQLPMEGGKLARTGKVGADVSAEEGKAL